MDIRNNTEKAKQTAPTAARRKRKRTLVAEVQQPAENEYELQRAERMARNADVLRQLGLAQSVAGLQLAVAEEAAQLRQQQQQAQPRLQHRLAQRLPRPERAVPPTARKSARMAARRGEAEVPLQRKEAHVQVADAEGAGALLELDVYFKQQGVDTSNSLRSAGHFHGWVKPELCQAHGIAGDPAAAWEAGGGGKFSFKIDKKALPSSAKAKGWSDARAFSSTQLCKNPNSYFYRHVAPGEVQAQGEWTQEEHELFLDTAKRYGAGDKWGLFSTYIPQRVGYQCSAYYRDLITQGLILDPRFCMTRCGKAVFVG